MNRIACLVGFCVALIAGNARASLAPYCASVANPTDWSYCVTRDSQSTNHDVVYYLHGKGGDETSWQADQEAVEQEWADSRLQPPTIVTISFGKRWLLVDKNSSGSSGLLDVFLDDVIRKVESEVGGVKGRRIVFGVSMGGFNALQLLLKRPDLFKRAVIACPGLAHLSPVASESEIASYVSRTGADPNWVRDHLKLMRSFIPDAQTWSRESPLDRAASAMSPSWPAMHVSCGTHDEFGFFTGAKELADLARSHGIRVEWQEVDGGHCSLDPISIARFLVGN